MSPLPSVKKHYRPKTVFSSAKTAWCLWQCRNVAFCHLIQLMYFVLDILINIILRRQAMLAQVRQNRVSQKSGQWHEPSFCTCQPQRQDVWATEINGRGDSRVLHPVARWSRGMILAYDVRDPGFKKSRTSPSLALEPLFLSSISPCCLLWANRTPPSSKASATSVCFQDCITPIFLVPRLQFKLGQPLSSVG